MSTQQRPADCSELAQKPSNIFAAKIMELCRGRILLLGRSSSLSFLPFLTAVQALPTYVIDENIVEIQKFDIEIYQFLKDYCHFLDLEEWEFKKDFYDTVLLTKFPAFGLDIENLLKKAHQRSRENGRIVIAFTSSEDYEFSKNSLNTFLTQYGLEVIWKKNVPDKWKLGYIDKLSNTNFSSNYLKKLSPDQCLERVSVIIPTYNRAHWLPQAIESVLNQTYSNIEIIVVNHGSTDNTEEVLNCYKDAIRIVYVKNSSFSPQGASLPINAGIKIATGKYICRLDDDDIFLPLKIECQIKAFRNTSYNVGLVHSQFFLINEFSEHLSYVPRGHFNRTETRLFLLSSCRFNQPTVMVKKECHNKVGLYDTNLKIVYDYDMWIRILRHYDLFFISLPLAKYRFHQTNVSSASHSGDNLFKDHQYLFGKLLRLDLFYEFSSELERLDDPDQRNLLLARAFTSRGEGALKWGLVTEAKKEFKKATKLCPDVLQIYKEKWAKYPSIIKNIDEFK